MSDYREHVRVALEAITVHSQTSYSWFGQLSSRLPAKVRRMLSPQDARSYLLYDLSSRLYNCFYVKGAAITSKIDDDPLLPTGLTPFVAALSTANSGSGCLEDGWSVRAIENGSVTLMHGDLVVWVRPHECLLTEGGSIAPGMTVHLRLPKELLGMSPGFYMVLGDKALRPDSEQTLIRVYWNIRGESAVSFVGIASKLLNQRPSFPIWTRRPSLINLSILSSK
jgi:hypothetical protein